MSYSAGRSGDCEASCSFDVTLVLAKTEIHGMVFFMTEHIVASGAPTKKKGMRI
ncbi:MAG TPA: hypothetical protein VGG77_13545 [Roseiarcus sp.]